GNGDGTFQAPIEIAPAGTARPSVVLSDFNGDGYPDAAFGAAYGLTQIFFNNGGSSFSSGNAIDEASRYDAGLVAGDVDKDGDMDLIAVDATGAGAALYLNTNRGQFNYSGIIGASGTALYSALVFDADADGLVDLFTGGLSNTFYRNTATTTGTPPTGDIVNYAAIPFGSGARNTLALALGDLNADGRADLVEVNNREADLVYLNTGDAAMPFASSIAFGGAAPDSNDVATAAVIADFNGDAAPDLIVGSIAPLNSTTFGGAKRIYVNGGSGTGYFGGGSTAIGSGGESTNKMVAGDVNGDGKTDFIAGNGKTYVDLLTQSKTYTPQINKLYIGDGAGGFTEQNIGTQVDFTSSLALAELNGDMKLDLVVGNRYDSADPLNSRPVRLYLNNGTATPFSVAPLDVGVDTLSTSDLVIGDVSGDGYPDLIVAKTHGQTIVYINNQTADPFTGVSPLYVTAATEPQGGKLVRADVNKDGWMDIVQVIPPNVDDPLNPIYYPVMAYINTASSTDPFNSAFGGQTGVVLAYGSEDWFAGLNGDVNADGTVEIIAGNGTNGPSKIFLPAFSPPAVVSSAPITAPYTIARATLSFTGSVPTNTSVEFYLTNGTMFKKIIPDQEYVFPAYSTDLQWKAYLRSASPSISPRIDSVTVTYLPPNQPPNVFVAPTMNVDEGAAVSLDASGAVDPDGTVVSWSWAQTGGTSVTLAGADTAIATMQDLMRLNNEA
ncbi:VCBS repeat-containing protein, partial [bacterium]